MNPISPISASTPAAPEPVPPPRSAPQDRTLNAALSGAVQSLNEAGYAGTGREISLSFDPATRRPVIEVVDTETNKVLIQWPSAYVLELAQEQKRNLNG
jgi:uncharacterized FlaG/YvyC family protein